MHKKGIVRKTFLFAALLIVVVMTLSFAILYFVMPGYYQLKKEQTLRRNLDVLTADLNSAETQDGCATLIADFCQSHNVSVTAYGGDGQPIPELSSPFVSYNVVFFHGEDVEGGVHITQGGEGELPPFAIIRGAEIRDSGSMMVQAGGAFAERRVSQVVSLYGNVADGPVRAVEVRSPLQPIDEAQNVMLTLIPYVLLFGLATGLVFAWFYARQLSRPILKISDAAVRMQRLDADVTSGVGSNDEIGLLSQNLDALYAHLRDNIDSLRDEMDKVSRLERAKTDMMRSAGHELKTPIAALSGMLDGMVDNVGAYRDREKYLPVCKEQVEKLSALVYEILNASRDDAPEGGDEEIDVGALLERALEDCAVSIRERRLRVTQVFSPAIITANPTRLYRVLSNLIRNAACYTPEGGEITVIVDNTRCAVENDCDLMPEDEVPKLFEPFYTGSFSRDRVKNGTGLGLYIVAQNLERMGIAYEARCIGERFVFRLEYK